MTYKILIERGAIRDLRRLDRTVAERVMRKLEQVAERGYGFEPLTNFEYGWKIRIGDYRALCDIDISLRVIKVHLIAHRREVYR